MIARFTILNVLFLVISVCAGELMIDGGKTTEAAAYFQNYFEPEFGVIFDIALPSGGPDAGKSQQADVSAIIIDRPETLRASAYQYPNAVGFAIRADPQTNLRITVTLVNGKGISLGPVAAALGSLDVFWNSTRIGTVQAPQHTGNTEPPRFVDLELDVPAANVTTENLLWVAATQWRPVVIDALQITGDTDLGLLSRDNARALAEKHNFCELRSLAGKGRVLICDYLTRTQSQFQHEICVALNADVDAVTSGTSTDVWLSPFKWAPYKLVVLRTRHQLTPAESQGIDEFVKTGGTVIVSAETLIHFTQESGRIRAEHLGWLGSFRAGYRKLNGGTLTLAAVAAEDNAADLVLQRPAGGICAFTPAGELDKDAVRMQVSWSEAENYRSVALFVRQHGNGTVIGTITPIESEYVRMLRDILWKAMQNKRDIDPN